MQFIHRTHTYVFLCRLYSYYTSISLFTRNLLQKLKSRLLIGTQTVIKPNLVNRTRNLQAYSHGYSTHHTDTTSHNHNQDNCQIISNKMTMTSPSTPTSPSPSSPLRETSNEPRVIIEDVEKGHNTNDKPKTEALIVTNASPLQPLLEQAQLCETAPMSTSTPATETETTTPINIINDDPISAHITIDVENEESSLPSSSPTMTSTMTIQETSKNIKEDENEEESMSLPQDYDNNQDLVPIQNENYGGNGNDDNDSEDNNCDYSNSNNDKDNNDDKNDLNDVNDKDSQIITMDTSNNNPDKKENEKEEEQLQKQEEPNHDQIENKLDEVELNETCIAATTTTMNNINDQIEDDPNNTSTTHDETTNVDNDGYDKNDTNDHDNNDQNEQKISSLFSSTSSTTATATEEKLQPNGIKLKFDNFVDLQTRLVLLPYRDDECTGASVASYMAAITANENGNHNDEEANVTGYVLTGIPSSVKDANGEDVDNGSEKCDWTREDYTNILSAIRDAPTPTILQFHDPEEWQTYQELLVAAMQQQQSTNIDTEATIEFHHDASSTGTGSDIDDSSESTFSNSNDDSSLNHNDHNNVNMYNNNNTIDGNVNGNNREMRRNEDEEKKSDDRTNNDDTTPFKGRFQRWGSHFAAEATKAVIAGKVKVNERFMVQQQLLEQQSNQELIKPSQSDDSNSCTQAEKEAQRQDQKNNEKDNIQTSRSMDDRDDLCGIFLQTSSGKCLPLKQSLYKDILGDKDGKSSSRRNLFKKAPPIISNTSVLVIRKSISDACPTLGYRYQWYSTSRPQIELSQYDENSDGKCSWRLLDGENSIMFQPSVTHVGYRIKCVVTIDSIDEVSPTDFQGGSRNSTEVDCELPFVIENDQTLFNATIKTFVPLSEGAIGMQVSSFGNLIGRDEFEGLQLRVNLYTMQDNGIQGGFYMSFSANTEKPIHDADKPIIEANACSFSCMAKSFHLLYRFGPSEEFNMLKLKSPSRLARETFLIALGIAKYEGDIANLTKNSVLYPDSGSFSPIDKKICVLEAPKHCEEKEGLSEAIEHQFTCLPANEIDKGTPVNSKMIALEGELEKDMVMMRDKLEAKNQIVSELHHELDKLRDDHKASEEKYLTCKKNLRLHEKRVESLESDIKRMKKDFKAHQLESEKKFEEKSDVAQEYDKVIKSLRNEKAVLSAAIEARDSKLAKMSAQLNDADTLRHKAEAGEKAQHELEILRKKNKKAMEEMNKMKEDKNHSMIALEKAKKKIDRLEADYEIEKKTLVTVKTEGSKIKLQFQKTRGERNTYKQKADSLAKEMSRICRNGKSINDIEKMIQDYQSLSSEVVQLRSEKKKALYEVEECKTDFEQYVKAQIQAKTDNEAIRVFQRNIELERVVTEMTEYLNAKQMQLESVQDANRALTEELRLMAENCRGQNDI